MTIPCGRPLAGRIRHVCPLERLEEVVVAGVEERHLYVADTTETLGGALGKLCTGRLEEAARAEAVDDAGL